MTLQQIIEDMERQIVECESRNEPHNEASFGIGIGVVVSWGDAQAIIKALKDSLDAPQPPNAPTPTYEWTLDDSELPPTKKDTDSILERIADLEIRMGNVVSALHSIYGPLSDIGTTIQ